MPSEDNVKIVLKFIEKINEHNEDGLADLMTDDHLFVDSLGGTANGREQMRNGWVHYFGAFPDFKITYTDILQNGDTVALFGTASGTYCPKGEVLEENRWQMPAAWKAVVRDNRIAEWHVYADNHPVFEIMAANRA
ncbi:MAG TPA: nuclear transport factor 2 family protein [Blastocatellia bacterium]|jgi:uncharacterized protein (TIGR02246 family)